MLKPYDVVIDGNPTTLLLSDADAKERGLTAAAAPTEAPAKSVRAPANKQRTAANK